MPAPDDDLQAEMYARGREMLAAAGYVHYEISNWARPGRECAHNLTYWRCDPYLGFGPGAHSYDGRRRWWTVSAPRLYIERVEAGESPVAGGEDIDRQTAMAETMILGLRLLQEGVSRERFRARFGVDPVAEYGSVIGRLARWGLLEVDAARVRLAARAYAVANRVVVDFLP